MLTAVKLHLNTIKRKKEQNMNYVQQNIQEHHIDKIIDLFGTVYISSILALVESPINCSTSAGRK